MPKHDEALELPIEQLAERLGGDFVGLQPLPPLLTMTSTARSSIQDRACR